MSVIFQRELSKEARRPRSFLIRLICSVAGYLSALFLLFISDSGNGRWMFSTLTYAGFGFCLIQGARAAAGTIADEKRAGTLPLLLLTPQGSVGIVVGKLLAVGVPLIQPFLAFVPALTITILMGGVTGGEIVRAFVVIACTLALSVSAGLCVSSFNRKPSTEGRTTLAIIAVTTVLPILLGKGSFSFLRPLSPWTAFQEIADESYRVSGGLFWLSFLCISYAAIVFLMAAIYFLPRRWEMHVQPSPGRWRIGRRERMGSPERGAMLDQNPGLWLALRNIASKKERIIFAAMIGALCIGTLNAPARGTGFWLWFTAALATLTKIAAQASYPFSDARRSGAAEILACTPLPAESLVSGQQFAMVREFLAPVLMIVFTAFLFAMGSSNRMDDSFWMFTFMALGFALWAMAVASLGMFASLLEKSPTSAFYTTILVGVVIAGALTLLFPPLPLLALFGFCENRLRSDQLPQFFRRPARA